MRRGGAEPMLAVHPARAPAFARVERGPRGVRLIPVEVPGDVPQAPAVDLVLESAAPVALRAAALVAGGTWVLGIGTLGGVAYSLALPRIRVVHDRRPPGLDGVVGAADVNAGVLHADGGWRAVVLPSLGDVAADIGDGPVAIRADGRRVAIGAGNGIDELAVGGDGEGARHAGAAQALAYTGDGTLLVARGAAVGTPDVAPQDGPAVIALAGAAAAPRAAALHDDGTVTVWTSGGGDPVARWTSPVEGAATIALSPDGERVELGVPEGDAPAAGIARAADGALVRRVEGARVVAATPAQDGLLVAGDWGCAWLIDLPDPKE